MKKILILSCLILYFGTMAYAQDKIEAPVWNVGDKWIFTSGDTMMIMNADENSYMVKFLTSRGEEYISIRDKSSLNILYSMEGDKRIEYKGGRKRLLNFPLDIGKSWKDKFVSRARRGTLGDAENTYFETFIVLGSEDIVVKAGKFRAIKLEYKQEGMGGGRTWQGKAWYWYSPDVKYLVKCQYEKNPVWTGFYDWELTSFELK